MTISRAEPSPSISNRTGLMAWPHAALVALAIAAGSAATIIGAYIFQYIVGIPPCPLCLDQRIPHYIVVPLALLTATGAARKAPRMVVALGFGLLALVLLAGAGIGAYHSGVEWKFWPGPTDCSGPIKSFGNAGSLLEQMQKAVVVRCDEVRFRFLGLSLAGYNVLLSLSLAALAGWGLVRTLKRAD